MFSKEKADWAVQFIESLTHTKGEWMGKPFVLSDWQRMYVRELFGRTRDDGLRQYRTSYMEIPRKNGKTELAAGLALFLLFGDNEPGAEIYSAAAERGQAALVFNAAATMVRNNPTLLEMCKIIDSQKRIVFYKTNSFYCAISAEAYSKHGFNAHAVIYDELHCAPNSELWDTLITSMGARTQPLMIALTTAGDNRNSICWEQHDYAKKVLEGTIEDDTFLPLLFGADEDDDWTDEKVWYKANPNLGVSVKIEHLRRECKKAMEIPRYQNTFRRLYLNQWTTQETRWLNMIDWRNCGSDFDPDYLSELRCWAGVDLSSTTDLSSCALVFEPDSEGVVHVLSYNWIPGDNIQKRATGDNVPYDLWVDQEHLIATDGNVIDHDYIRLMISNTLKEQFPLLEVVGYDPWNATKWAIDLEGDGVPVVQIRQGYRTLSPACKELEKLVLSKALRHNNNPVLTWAMDNVVVTTDPAENIKPAKDKARERIDPAVALIVAIATMLEFQEEDINIYESRGLLSL